MKLNIAYPATGCQKCIEIDDEKKLRCLYDKRMSQEVAGDELGDQFKGYVFKIMGGNDKQGFPMKQGVLTNTRVRLLLAAGDTCYRPRRKGERKRKSVRGCIVGPDISVVHLVVVKKGDDEVEGLTDKVIPRRLGPKRASKIRKLFNLSKEDDVRKYVIRREITPKEGKPAFKKPRSKAPKIQRLVTPVVLQRRRRVIALKKKRAEKTKKEIAEYATLLKQRSKERMDKKRRESISKKRAQRDSQKKDSTTTTSTTSTAKSTSTTTAKPTTATKQATQPVKQTSTTSKPTATKQSTQPATKQTTTTATKQASKPAKQTTQPKK